MGEQVKPKSLRPRKYFKYLQRAAIHARDLKALNQAVERLNREAEDVLEYQASGEKGTCQERAATQSRRYKANS